MDPLALVTGAPGWLGTRLVAALSGSARGAPARDAARRVRCLVYGGTDTVRLAEAAPTAEIVRGDLTSQGSLGPFVRDAEGATVFHVAGLIHPRLRTSELHSVNVEGTRVLVDAARRAGVRRFVYVSSNSAVGMNRHREDLFDEQSLPHPYMTYGKTKRLAEEMVFAAHRRGDFEAVVVRPMWFYGPGQPARQTRFFSMVRRGLVPMVGDGSNRRSLAYVDDVCQALLLCEAAAAAAGQVYWIADGRPYAMREIIDTVELVMERDFDLSVARKRVRLPAIVSDLAWLLDRGLQACGTYNQEIHVLSEMKRTIACSIAKAQRELGYEPTVGLEEGMRRSIEWVLRTGGTP
jgi:nucleoside-diphosphate-sugar epimerase